MTRRQRRAVVALAAAWAAARVIARVEEQRVWTSYYNGMLRSLADGARDRVQTHAYITGASDDLPESMGGPKR